MKSCQKPGRGVSRSAAWGLCLLGLWLFQACAVPPEIVPSGGAAGTPDRVWLSGKRFKPGKTKPAAQPSKPPGTTSAANGSPASVRGIGPSYKLGESDGGPGQWEKAPVRPKGASYQKDVTGAPEGVEYAVPAQTPSGKVLFDGYKDRKLLDAKDWEQWPPANATFWRQGVLDDAEKQLRAARGTPIEWHFPNEEKAQAVRQLLEDENIGGIDVKVTQKK